ncbi:MAG: hypothetical protein AAB914_03100 [Patescibacteria group bacterium]
MSNIQYTIRGVPEPVDKVLRTRAKSRGISFNRAAIEALMKDTGQVTGNTNREFDQFFGNLIKDKKSFDQAQDWLDKLPKELQ